MLASTNPLRLATRQCSRLPALRAYASAPHGAQGGAGGGPANLANPTGEHKATSHESGRMTPQGGSPNYALIVAGAGVAGYIAWKYFASATEAKDQLASTNLRQTGATGSTGENDPVLTRQK